MQKIPEGFNTITCNLNVEGAAQAIELYKKAFGAKEISRMTASDNSGKIIHACIQIGDSKLFIADVMPEMGCAEPSVTSFYLYMEDVDSAFKQAKQAGLEEKYPVTDMFWGDRTGSLKDKFGVMWTIATHVRDVSDEEMKEGQKKFMKQAA